MRRIKFSLLVLFILIVVRSASCQDTTSAPIVRYYNQFLGGLLIGKSSYGVTPSCMMIHGFRVNKIAAGAGISYEVYGQWQTIPIVGSMSWDIGKIKNGNAFIQLTGGPTLLRHRGEDTFYYTHYNEKGGRMLQAALGYRLSVEKWSLYIAGGFRSQRIVYSTTSGYGWWSHLEPGKSSVVQDMNRAYVQLGFGFH